MNRRSFLRRALALPGVLAAVPALGALSTVAGEDAESVAPAATLAVQESAPVKPALDVAVNAAHPLARGLLQDDPAWVRMRGMPLPPGAAFHDLESMVVNSSSGMVYLAMSGHTWLIEAAGSVIRVPEGAVGAIWNGAGLQVMMP